MGVNREILKTKSVISKYELFGITTLFIVILILLFPKGKLEKLIYTDTANYDFSIKYLECLSKAYPKDTSFRIALLRFYLKAGKLKKSETIYLRLFQTAKNQRLKTKYFINAINVLVWNKKYKEAVILAKKYENYFMKTRNKLVLKKILEVYLQTGNLGLARNLSSKILRAID